MYISHAFLFSLKSNMCRSQELFRGRRGGFGGPGFGAPGFNGYGAPRFDNGGGFNSPYGYNSGVRPGFGGYGPRYPMGGGFGAPEAGRYGARW